MSISILPLALKAFAQRGIYLTFFDGCVIISTCKAIYRRKMCPQRLPEPGKTKLPLGRAQGIPGA
jgi:hypothetical protein